MLQHSEMICKCACSMTTSSLGFGLRRTSGQSLFCFKQELFPANKRSCEHFSKYFTDAGLKELSDFARNQQSIGARKELQKELQEQMARGETLKDVSRFITKSVPIFSAICLICAALTLSLSHVCCR